MFESEKCIRFDWFKQQFLERYTTSKMKHEFLKEEISKCEDIMSGVAENNGKFRDFTRWNLSFETNSLFYIQQYFLNTIKRGIPMNFDAIHSSNFKFHDNIIFNSSIYAQALWEYCEWLKQFKVNLSDSSSVKGKKTLKTQPVLIDIWIPDKLGSKKSYDSTIEFLLKESLSIDASFIKEVNGDLYWNKHPATGWVQYMAAFIHTCIVNGCILNTYSSVQFKNILCKTFNIDRFDPKPFKSIGTTPPADKYLIPFSSFFKKSKD